MDIIQFPPARVLEINHYILGASPGHQGPASIALLEGALGRIDNAIAANLCSAVLGLWLIDPLWHFIVSIS